MEKKIENIEAILYRLSTRQRIELTAVAILLIFIIVSMFLVNKHAKSTIYNTTGQEALSKELKAIKENYRAAERRDSLTVIILEQQQKYYQNILAPKIDRVNDQLTNIKKINDAENAMPLPSGSAELTEFFANLPEPKNPNSQ